MAAVPTWIHGTDAPGLWWQAGHAIFEPVCHDNESLLLGFNTRSKCFAVASYVIAPALAIYQLYRNPDVTSLLKPAADLWLTVTIFFVVGHTAMLWLLHGFRIAMVWLLKLLSDPFTDLQAYYPSLWKVWSSPDWKTGSFQTLKGHLKGHRH
mmetsp:Transcript_4529/g.16236  ORF Transcript_4529/g.16236 Transcript_4529/m.16236 type:complete len:152 (+) Transcript_4529:2045-2500(+)|eukprot:scaffold13_cov377-Prasinococcus_capsulatus_cf.AAC.25